MGTADEAGATEFFLIAAAAISLLCSQAPGSMTSTQQHLPDARLTVSPDSGRGSYCGSYLWCPDLFLASAIPFLGQDPETREAGP